MPKVFGLNVLGVMLASLAFFMIGFLFYGVLFVDLWMSIEGVTEADAEGAGMGWLLPAFGITLAQVVGVGLLLQWTGAQSISSAVKKVLIVWALFAVPLMAYDPIYIPNHSVMSLWLDGAHLLAGWLASAIILTLIK